MEPFGPVFEGDQQARAALGVLLEALQQRHAGSVLAVLFYGSCPVSYTHLTLPTSDLV